MAASIKVPPVEEVAAVEHMKHSGHASNLLMQIRLVVGRCILKFHRHP